MAESQSKSADELERIIVRFLQHDLHTRYPGYGTRKADAPSTRSVAKDVGTNNDTVSKVANAHGGRKPAFETMWARKFYADSLDRLVTAAVEWHAANPEESMLDDALERLSKRASAAKADPATAERLAQAVFAVIAELDGDRPKRPPAKPPAKTRSTGKTP